MPDTKYLEEIHKVQINMLKDLHFYCVENNIRYTAVAGTLLGALRHKGIIPWDDDIDIGLERNEYEKLTGLLKTKPLEGYFLQDYSTEKHYMQPYAKLRLNGSVYLEKFDQNVDINHGIFIDIFPLDYIKKPGSSESKFRRVLTRAITFSIWRKEKCNVERKGAKKIEYVISKIIGIIPKKSLVKIQNNLAVKKSGGNYLASIFSSNYSTERYYITKDEMDNSIMLPFDGVEIMSISNPEAYLKRLYGDYMKLPPIEKRNSGHTVVKIEYNTGGNR